MTRFAPTLTLLAALLTGGCAVVPREAGFGDVQKTVVDRTGQKVHWNQGTPADDAVAQQVKTMLGKEVVAEKAVQIALLNNRELQATYEDLSIAQADLVSAGLLKNPVFDADIRFFEGGGTSAELAVTQSFLDILFIPIRKRFAAAAFEAAKMRVAGAVIDLAGEVRSSFYTYQGAEQTLEFRRQVMSATEASYDLAKRLRAAGNTKELDLFNERALYEQTKIEVRSAEAEVLRARERLNVLMGLWGPQTSWTATHRLPGLPATEVAAEGLERQAVERSLELSATRQQFEQAAAALGMAQPLGVFSDTALGVSADHETDGNWGLGPAFSIPIPLFNQGQPAIASAQAEIRRTRALYAARAVAVRSQVRTALAAVLAARDQVEYYAKVIIPLRQRIVDQTQLQYNAMQLGAFQLLQAKQQQIDAANAYLRTLRDYWLARTELERILSGGSASFRESDSEANTQTLSPAAMGRGGH